MAESITAADLFRSVMTVDPPDADDPYHRSAVDFLFGQVWSRPGLSRRDRRWVTLVCVAYADAPEPLAAHVYAALNSDDMTIDELLEFVLHFAVYCGWPKAARLEGAVRTQWARLQTDRGQEPTPLPALDDSSLGPVDPDDRLASARAAFAEINLLDAPVPQTPFVHAGVLGFVFGHVWQRPGLDRRSRRVITVTSVIVCDVAVAISSHLSSALGSGDLTKDDMDEIALHLAAYAGFTKGEALQVAADATWQQQSH